MAKANKARLTQKERLMHEAADRPSRLEAAARAARSPAGDDRIPSGSVSELQSAVAELHAIIAGASALISYNSSAVESDSEHLGDVVELLSVAGFRCDELRDLLEPEVAHG